MVPADREDWSVDPFKLTEQDGYFYARGSGDDKYMAASFIANLIRYRQEGYKPDRDIIVALETDEEILDRNALGIQWLLKNHRDLIDAEFALNEGGGVGLKDGKPIRVSIQTSEKVSMGYQLTVKNKGGHSSLPVKDNAIYHLAEGLVRLSSFSFPVNLNETTRAYFERTAQMEGGQLADDLRAVLSGQTDPASPELARLSASAGFKRPTADDLRCDHAGRWHRYQRAAATGDRQGQLPDHARRARRCRQGDARARAGRRSDRGDAARKAECECAICAERRHHWPHHQIVRRVLARRGGVAGDERRRHRRQLPPQRGHPTYGHSGMASDINDSRAHGRDERVLVKSFYQGDEYLYRLVKALAGGH